MHRGSNTLHRNRKTIVRRLFDEVLCRVRSTLNHRYWTVPRGLLQWVVPLSAPTTQGSMRVCSRLVSAGCLQRSHPDLRKGVGVTSGTSGRLPTVLSGHGFSTRRSARTTESHGDECWPARGRGACRTLQPNAKCRFGGRSTSASADLDRQIDRAYRWVPGTILLRSVS